MLKRNIVFVLLASVTLFSCKTLQERCNDAYPPKVIVKETVKDSIVRDTVTITIPGNAIELNDSVPCDDFIKELEDTRTKLSIVVKNGKAKIKCECKEQELQIARDNIIRTITKDRLELRQTAPDRKKDSWFSHWETWLCLALAALWLFGKIAKLFKFKIGFTLTPPFITLTR